MPKNPSRILISSPRRLQVACIGLLLLLPLPAVAVEGTLTADKDNSLYEHPDGSQSNGSGDYLFVGRSNGLSQRALVFFDIAGSIPDGSTIESVSLTMNVSSSQAGTDNVSLHRLLADWGEGDSVDGEEGRGATATRGDATWIHSFSSDTMWENPGGDFTSIASADLGVGGIGNYTWTSTPDMIGDVQGWLDDPSTNFGWILIGNESGGTTAKRFDSREHQSEANHPVLTIVFDLTAVDDMSWGMIKLEAR